MKLRIKNLIKNNLVIILLCFGIFFLRTAIADWNPVPSGSMEPTIYPGDVLLVNKTLLGPSIPFTDFRLFFLDSPKRGDIITFYPPLSGDDYVQFVKRVIGIPGDTIRVEGVRVYVNGKELPLTLDYDSQSADKLTGEETIGAVHHEIQVDPRRGIVGLEGEITVPPHKYFVMGDNRNNSEDSRFWGFVDEDKIIGKVTRIAVSIADERPLKDRFAHKIN